MLGLLNKYIINDGGNYGVKQWGTYFERAMTKEERDEWEKNYLFRLRYKDTFNAIGHRDERSYDKTDDEEE